MYTDHNQSCSIALMDILTKFDTPVKAAEATANVVSEFEKRCHEFCKSMMKFAEEHKAESVLGDMSMIIGYRSVQHDPDKCGLQIIGSMENVVRLSKCMSGCMPKDIHKEIMNEQG